ncbi:DUF499 domain-containing protein [Rhodoflexus sp.]
MTIQTFQDDNLRKAFGTFIEAFRYYVMLTLRKAYGEIWLDRYGDVLTAQQKEYWQQSLESGSDPMALIDYSHLKNFALKYKDLLRDDFGKEVNNVATYLDSIYRVRNKSAHYQKITDDDFADAFVNMKKIARAIGMTELEQELIALQSAKNEQESQPQPKSVAAPAGSSGLVPWFRVVTPHTDIKEGRLDESVFAANLAEVAFGSGREIYSNSSIFFSKTYLTAGLRNVAKTVLKGLNGSEDAENRVISLQTGFGGGKTHTLISLYHLAQWGSNAIESRFTKELFAYTGNPAFEKANVAVFTNTTNDPTQGRYAEEGVHIQTIWGELAYQLGGKAAYELVRKNDEARIAPAGIFKKVLEQCKPALILIDELADYCVKASGHNVGSSNLSDQTISFIQELTEAVAAANHCVAVITLPASVQEVGNTEKAHAILASLQKRVGRVSADTKPVADEEIYEVIRRRLFEQVGDASVIESIASQYMLLYQSHSAELPSAASRSEYKQRIIKSYPFHPELIDTFRVRWGSHHDFQRTRGVLRLLAAIVSDLWKRQQSLSGANALIHTGVVNFANLDALSGQLKRLYGHGYDAVISADVAGSSSNAFKIDSAKNEYGQWNLTQSIASVILMNSFGSEGANKGVSVQEIKLHLLSPEGFNHNSINGALDELESNAYYLYYSQSSSAAGKRYWFYTKPNINILINQAKGDIQAEDITAEVLKRLQQKIKNVSKFKVLIDPSGDIPEQQQTTLLLLNPNYTAKSGEVSGSTLSLIERIATKKGNSERIYRNNILFMVCSELGINKLESTIREYLACRKIYDEYNNQLESEQKQDLKKRIEDAAKGSDSALSTAYSIIVKYSVKNGAQVLQLKEFKDSLDAQINSNVFEALKAEEWLLESIGLGTLRSHQLLPTIEQPVKVKDVYEAFLRFDDKPMITGKAAVIGSLLKYCNNGEYCIAAGDGKTFTRYFLKENVPFFDIDDTYWLVEKSLKPSAETASDSPAVSAGQTSAQQPSIVSEPQPGTLPKQPDSKTEVKHYKSITVSGKVPMEQYTQLFNSFIMPLANNQIEIEIRIKGKSTQAKPLTESSQEYKIVKESARQLGLNFDVEV